MLMLAPISSHYIIALKNLQIWLLPQMTTYTGLCSELPAAYMVPLLRYLTGALYPIINTWSILSSRTSLMFSNTVNDTSSHSVYQLKSRSHLWHVLSQPPYTVYQQICNFSYNISQINLLFLVSFLLIPTLVQGTIISHVNYPNGLLTWSYIQSGIHR